MLFALSSCDSAGKSPGNNDDDESSDIIESSDDEIDEIESSTKAPTQIDESSSFEEPSHVCSYDKWDVLREPTCTKKGIGINICECGRYIDKEIPPLGHIEETIEGKEPTCIEEGLSDGKKCSSCGEILSEQETLPMIPHDYDNEGKCKGCPKTLSDAVLIVLDVSSSMGQKMDYGTRFAVSRDAILKLISDFQDHDYFGLILFDSEAHIAMELSQIENNENLVKKLEYNLNHLFYYYYLDENGNETDIIINRDDGTEYTDLGYQAPEIDYKTYDINGNLIKRYGTGYSPAILAASDMFSEFDTDVASKKLIFISDGEPADKGSGYDNIVKTMADRGIITSTMGINLNQMALHEMALIANAGNGILEIANDYETFYINLLKIIEATEFSSSDKLLYQLSDDKSYYIVAGIGTCTDSDIVIPSEHNGKPVAEIGYYAFEDCNSIKSITLPNTIKSTKDGAFRNCPLLKKVYFNGTAAEWCNISFGGFMPLVNYADLYFNGELVRDLVIPDTITEIKRYAFAECTSIKSITIPSSVTSIESGAFANCPFLNSATIIGDNLTEIESDSFYNCYRLAEIYNPSSNELVSRYCRSARVIHTSLNEPSILEIANDYIFMTYEDKYYLIDYIGSDTELVLPEAYKGNNYEIYNFAFYKRDAITSITIPSSVSTIGQGAFLDCFSLKSITIPNSVTSIMSGVFTGCDKLEKINYLGTLEQWCNCNITSSLLSVAADLYFDGVLVTDIVISSSIKSIRSGIFQGCASLKSVIIQDGVTLIESNAFKNCTALESVTIPSSIKSIEASAFQGCTSLENVTIQNGVTSIGNFAFQGCSSLESLIIPDSIVKIGLHTFDLNTSVTSQSNKLILKYYISDNSTCMNESHDHYALQLFEAGQQITLSNTPCTTSSGNTFFGWFTQDGIFYEGGATVTLSENTILYAACGKEINSAEELKNYLSSSGQWKYAKLTADISLSRQNVSINWTSFSSAIIDLNGHNITSSNIQFGFGEQRTGMIFIGEGTINFTSNNMQNGAFFTTSFHGYGDGAQKLWIGKDVKIISNVPLIRITNSMEHVPSLPSIRIYGEITAPSLFHSCGGDNMEISLFDSCKINITSNDSELVCDTSISSNEVIAKLTIFGGEYNLPKNFKGFVQSENRKIVLAIKGGSFNIDISEYLDDEYTLDFDGSMYTVIKK
ncbi:MAG: leucine-rich repeat protein [Clostridia bacterium]|nr:leucine-rich repeat protein [Clostridia bacterium]